MPKITKIVVLPVDLPQYPEARVIVYIDGQKCTTVRERTWHAMNLKVGDSISCDDLKHRERFHWKIEYSKKDQSGMNSWEKEKLRLKKVQNLIESIDPRIEVVNVGFGTDSIDIIWDHPAESGKPDIEVRLRETKSVILIAEVTGTESMRGDTYWVRPDKLAYANSHPDQNVWIILHYAKPSEKFVFIKPPLGREYTQVQKVINQSTEIYVEFTDDDEGVFGFEEFRNHLVSFLD